MSLLRHRTVLWATSAEDIDVDGKPELEAALRSAFRQRSESNVKTCPVEHVDDGTLHGAALPRGHHERRPRGQQRENVVCVEPQVQAIDRRDPKLPQCKADTPAR